MACTQNSTYTKTSDFIGPQGQHCDGWGFTSLEGCKEKCSNNELPKGCKEFTKNDDASCKYVIWDSSTHHHPGWCQLADDTCEVTKANDITEVWEKGDDGAGEFLKFERFN